MRQLCCNDRWTHQQKSVDVLLSSRCINTLYLTVRSRGLRITISHNNILKTACLVELGFEPLNIKIILPACVQSSTHFLTHSIGIKLKGIKSDDELAAFWRRLNACFFHNSFSCEHNWGTSNQIFSGFLQQIFVTFRNWIKLGFDWFVTTCSYQVWQGTSSLVHIISFILGKMHHPCHCSKCEYDVFFIVQRKKFSDSLHAITVPHFLQVAVIFCSSLRYLVQNQFSQLFIWR